MTAPNRVAAYARESLRDTLWQATKETLATLTACLLAALFFLGVSYGYLWLEGVW